MRSEKFDVANHVVGGQHVMDPSGISIYVELACAEGEKAGLWKAGRLFMLLLSAAWAGRGVPGTLS